jgi:hypothetical protein
MVIKKELDTFHNVLLNNYVSHRDKLVPVTTTWRSSGSGRTIGLQYGR